MKKDGMVYNNQSAPFKLILWGVGAEYNSLINSLKMWETCGQIQVTAVTAKEMMDVKQIDGWPVVKGEEFKKIDYDYLVICNDQQVHEIIADALRLGFKREKMIPSRVLKVPYFDWKSYDRILKSRISIISSNCWGGILCHTLGMECLSPFKNLWVSAADMIKMMPNLREYLSADLYFKRWASQPDGKSEYPVMGIKEIEIHFNHYEEIERAEADWMRRRRKVNYENLLVMIFTEEESEVEQFIKLDVRRKICFIPEHMNKWKENNDIWGMNYMPGQSELWDCVNYSARTGRNSYVFNILKMLEGKQLYRYEK